MTMLWIWLLCGLCCLLGECGASGAGNIPGNTTFILRSDYFPVTYSLVNLTGSTSFGYTLNPGVGPASDITMDFLLEDGTRESLHIILASYHSGAWKTYTAAGKIAQANLTTVTYTLETVPVNVEFGWSVYTLLYSAEEDEPQSAFTDKKNQFTASYPIPCAVTAEVPMPLYPGTFEVYFTYDEWPNFLNTWIVDNTSPDYIGSVEAIPQSEVDRLRAVNITIYNAMSQGWDSGRFFGIIYKSDDGRFHEVCSVVHDHHSAECDTTGLLPTLTPPEDTVSAACAENSDPFGGDLTGMLVGVLAVWATLAYLVSHRPKKLKHEGPETLLLKERKKEARF